MNIFYLDPDTRLCAQYHCDKHVVKMILETAQILSTNYNIIANTQNWAYGITQRNHPCVRWARDSIENWQWLRYLGIDLCLEYTYRWKKVHASQSIILNADPLAVAVNIPMDHDEQPMPIPQCMPAIYKQPDNPVGAYRTYYMAEKAHLLTYTRREIPKWVSDMGFGVWKG